METITENERVLVIREKVGEADYPITIVKNKKTNKRRVLIPLNGDYDVQFNGRVVYVNDVQWFGTWKILQDMIYEDYFVSIDIED